MPAKMSKAFSWVLYVTAQSASPVDGKNTSFLSDPAIEPIHCDHETFVPENLINLLICILDSRWKMERTGVTSGANVIASKFCTLVLLEWLLTWFRRVERHGTAILAWPVWLNNTLLHFTRPWTTPIVWRWSKPLAMSRPIAMTFWACTRPSYVILGHLPTFIKHDLLPNVKVTAQLWDELSLVLRTPLSKPAALSHGNIWYQWMRLILKVDSFCQIYWIHSISKLQSLVQHSNTVDTPR